MLTIHLRGSMDSTAGGASVMLRKVSSYIRPREDCRKLNPKVGSRDTVLCASGVAGGVCKYDSGGPLVDEKTRAVIGLSSFVLDPPEYIIGYVDECGKAPAVFTRVSGYIPFILENLGETGQTMDATQEDPEEAEQAARDQRLVDFCWPNFRDRELCKRAAFRCTGFVEKDASMDEFLGCVDRMQVCMEQRMDTDECRAKAKKCAETDKLILGDLTSLAECVKKDL